MLRAGIIGYGSIGRRHAGNLLQLGINDITLLRTVGSGNSHGLKETTDSAGFMATPFDFVIVSNPSTMHFSAIMPLLAANTNMLVEKPPVFTGSEADALEAALPAYKGSAMVAFNMRFHPCTALIKDIIDSGMLGTVWSARLFVGQYLPDWRPGTDYRTGVSALKKLGGGVVLELIHETDLAIHLFGAPAEPPKSVAARISDLQIETEDIAEILYRSDRNIIVSIHQDYLSRAYRRTISISGSEGALRCDLKEAAITVTGRDGTVILAKTIPFERNDMYLSMMKYYTGCLTSHTAPVPSLTEGLQAVRLALGVKNDNNL